MNWSGGRIFFGCFVLAVVAGSYFYSQRGGHDNGKIVITIGHPALGFQSIQQAWDDVIAKFEEENPNIDVVSVRLESNKVALMTAAQMLPDIYSSNSFNVFHERLRAENLTPYLERDKEEFRPDDYIPELIADCRLNGKTLMLPWFYNISLLYYNVDMFEEAGVEPPTADWTWDDFIEASKKFAKYDQDGKQIRWGTNIVWGWWSQWLTYVTQSGGTLFNDDWTRTLLDSPEAIEGLRAYRDLVLKYKVAPTQREMMQDPFLNQQTAILWGGHTWNWIGFRSHAKFRWDVALLPKGPVTRRGGERVSGTFCIYRHSKHKEEAWKLLKWINSEWAEKKWVEVGLTPVRKSIAQNVFLHKNDKGKYDVDPQHREVALEAIKYGVNQPIMPDFAEVVLNFYQPLIDQMMRGNLSPEEVGKRGTERANNFLKMMGRSREKLEQETGI